MKVTIKKDYIDRIIVHGSAEFVSTLVHQSSLAEERDTSRLDPGLRVGICVQYE